MLGQHMQMALGRETGRLTGFGRQVQHQRAAGPGDLQGGGQAGHQHMRDDAGEPGPRPEHHQIGAHHRVDGLSGGRRVAGQ